MAVTAMPRLRQDAATSRPMNPQPTIATRAASARSRAQRDRVVKTRASTIQASVAGRDAREGADARAGGDNGSRS